MPPGENDVPGYRLRAAVIHWQAGSGLSGAEDRVRRTLDNEEGPRVNPFFRELYRAVAATLAGLRAKEHTAQVPPAERQERERGVQRGRAAGPVLLADHGTRGGHQRAERRRAAQRAADAGELRAAGRPRGTIRAARAGGDLLRDRQRPRPVLLPAADRYGRRLGRPAPPGPGATRTWSGRTSRRSGSPKPARTCADRSPTCWMSAAPAPAWNSCPRSASGSPARLRRSAPLPGSRPCSPE